MVGAECSAIIAVDAKTCVYLAARKELRSWCMVSPPSLTAKIQSNHALFDAMFDVGGHLHVVDGILSAEQVTHNVVRLPEDVQSGHNYTLAAQHQDSRDDKLGGAHQVVLLEIRTFPRKVDSSST